MLYAIHLSQPVADDRWELCHLGIPLCRSAHLLETVQNL